MKYNISYQFIGGEIHLNGLTWFEFVQAINKIEDEGKAINNTVKVSSDVDVPLVKEWETVISEKYFLAVTSAIR